ncbi:nitroreductase/quinone reductase family protein [Mycolicibacterium sp. XJ870]
MLRHVDPHKKRGPVYGAMVRFGRSRTGQLFVRHVAARIDPWLYRITGGRFATTLGTIVTAPLTTTGAKSGQPREVQITYFHDGRDAIAVASNYGGAKHPQWYYNLIAHPDCELGGEPFSAAEVTDPDEYARLFALAERVYAGWRDYRVMTASVGRQIPIFRLEHR